MGASNAIEEMMKIKSNMTLNVEFLAGTTLYDAVEESIGKCYHLNLAYVCFEFNGVDFSTGRNANIFDVLEDYKNLEGRKFICHG